GGGGGWLRGIRVTPAATTKLVHPGQAEGRVNRHTSGEPGRGGARRTPAGAGAGGAQSTGALTSEQNPGADGERGHDGGVGDHVHSEAPGAVGDERQNDPEGGQAQELERLCMGQSEEDAGDDDRQRRADPPTEIPEQTGERAQDQAAE